MNLYGEWKQGMRKQNIILLTLGANLGASVLINGSMYYGCTENAWEIGHMHLYPKGRPCYCGSSACLGKYVSASGIDRNCKRKIKAKTFFSIKRLDKKWY